MQRFPAEATLSDVPQTTLLDSDFPEGRGSLSSAAEPGACISCLQQKLLPTRLITCATEWQEQQVFSFAHEVKAINNEVKDPHVIPLSKERPHTISVISEQIRVGLSQRQATS